jgi:hypothetical protein
VQFKVSTWAWTSGSEIAPLSGKDNI